MTGTSMATPMAASFTALLQQMVEEDYGYTPSAPMLERCWRLCRRNWTNQPDEMQGYGRPSLVLSKMVITLVTLISLKIGNQ